jgi:hypothetical protein
MTTPTEDTTTIPNVEQSAATQTQNEANLGIGFTKSYVKSFTGIMRMLLIVCTHLFWYFKCREDFGLTFFLLVISICSHYFSSSSY